MKVQDACDLFEKTIVVCISTTLYLAVVGGVVGLVFGIVKGMAS